MRIAFLALVFLAELAAWAAIGIGASLLVGGDALGWIVGVAAAAAAIVAWGLFASPKARAPKPVKLATKIVVFAASVVLLLLAGLPWWALALAALIAVAHVGVAATGGTDDVALARTPDQRRDPGR